MLKTKNVSTLLLLSLVSASCSSVPPVGDPVAVQPAKLAPAPADVLVERKANFVERLEAIFK